MSRPIGERPRPRLLLHGFDEDVAAGLQRIAPTFEHVDTLGQFLGDWDIVVSDSTLEGTESVFGIGIGCQRFGTVIESMEGANHRVHALARHADSQAREFEIGEDTPLEFVSLFKERLGPALLQSDSRPTIGYADMHMARGARTSDTVIPLLTSKEPTILALLVRRETRKETLCLPALAREDVVEWVEAAIQHWRPVDPVTFPSEKTWFENDDWLTAEEEDFVHELRALEARQAEYITEIATERRQVESKLAEATKAAERGPRALLSGGDEALVDAVSRVLEALGFAVENRDQVNPPTDRLEDLRVTDPTAPGWVVLAEIHPYPKGVKQADLIRLSGRFAKRFIRQEGRPPSGLWLIVNHFYGEDPSNRPPPLATNPEDRQVFADDDGVVIDTPSLFRLAKAIKRNQVDREALRQEMRAATGVWSWHPVDG
jgi:hypothetical protein